MAGPLRWLVRGDPTPDAAEWQAWWWGGFR